MESCKEHHLLSLPQKLNPQGLLTSVKSFTTIIRFENLKVVLEDLCRFSLLGEITNIAGIPGLTPFLSPTGFILI
jgi:hypothetical protein